MERKNLKVFGSKDSKGGIYGNITIMGSGDIHGDVECISYNVLGSGDVHGNLKSEHIKINGSGDILGDVEAVDLIINGSGDVHGNVRCELLKVAGSGDVQGNVYAREVSLFGSCEIQGDCETELFTGKGAFEIDGMLNAEEINIEVSGSSEVKEIGGGRIVVKRKEDMRGRKSRRHKTFTCDVIEGDEIFLENTTARIVRGQNIIIGENCEIERIEYVEECDINENARVESNQKLLK